MAIASQPAADVACEKMMDDTSRLKPAAESSIRMISEPATLDGRNRLPAAVFLTPKRRFRSTPAPNLRPAAGLDLPRPILSPSPRRPRMKRSGHFNLQWTKAGSPAPFLSPGL